MSEIEFPTFTDEELKEQGFAILCEEDVIALIKDAGIEVALMSQPVATIKGVEMIAKDRRVGTLENIKRELSHLREHGVKTIGLYEVHRWPFDKLTKIRWAYQVGV